MPHIMKFYYEQALSIRVVISFVLNLTLEIDVNGAGIIGPPAAVDRKKTT